MFNPSIYQRVKHKIIKKIEKYYAPLKQQQLNDTNITIISNNCWGRRSLRRIWHYKTKSYSRMLFIF